MAARRRAMPTLGEHRHALRWHAKMLDEYGWSNPDAQDRWLIPLYHLVDLLPEGHDGVIADDTGMTPSDARRLKRAGAWYVRGAHREHWPWWKRLLLPLGPARRTRRKIAAQRAHWSEDDQAFRWRW
ncbi:hypothetical protein [Miltoncostaea marina]|uniref:hypothetical protein n=1 Tax=Miltoncostaea marina TaxID=2843215 RepID=UPI001C3DCC94|nr:hypothetical protein [Miltoncostaea marina]